MLNTNIYNMTEKSYAEFKDIILTRYLYILDEVVINFHIQLNFVKPEFKEILFWLSEIYYSGFYELLWNIIYINYYDFYAYNYPLFKKYIDSYKSKWSETNDIKYIIILIKNMYLMDIDKKVFNIRMMANSENNKLTIYIPKKKSDSQNIKITSFEKSFLKQNLQNIAYYIESNRLIDIKNLVKKHVPKENKIKNRNLSFEFQKHILTVNSLFIKLFDKNNSQTLIKSKFKLINCKSNELDYFINTNNIDGIDIKNLLNIKREYTLSKKVFEYKTLRKENNLDIIKDILYNWSNYIHQCPHWNKILFISYAWFSIYENKILFRNEFKEEKFYNKYSFNPLKKSKLLL